MNVTVLSVANEGRRPSELERTLFIPAERTGPPGGGRSRRLGPRPFRPASRATADGLHHTQIIICVCAQTVQLYARGTLKAILSSVHQPFRAICFADTLSHKQPHPAHTRTPCGAPPLRLRRHIAQRPCRGRAAMRVPSLCCLGQDDLKRHALPARWRSCPVSYTAFSHGNASLVV